MERMTNFSGLLYQDSSPTVREGLSYNIKPSLTVGLLPHGVILMYKEFDDNEFPLAYLITIRCYGTWLHGDSRGSMNRQGYNIYGTQKIPQNQKLELAEKNLLKHPPVNLEMAHRTIDETTIREVCKHRGYFLHAINPRTNHVHTVVSANIEPEFIMNSFKSYSTRGLREHGSFSRKIKPWSRHGSTRYLWKQCDVERAIDYVLNCQGEELPDWED